MKPYFSVTLIKNNELNFSSIVFPETESFWPDVSSGDEIEIIYTGEPYECFYYSDSYLDEISRKILNTIRDAFNIKIGLTFINNCHQGLSDFRALEDEIKNQEGFQDTSVSKSYDFWLNLPLKERLLSRFWPEKIIEEYDRLILSNKKLLPSDDGYFKIVLSPPNEPIPHSDIESYIRNVIEEESGFYFNRLTDALSEIEGKNSEQNMVWEFRIVFDQSKLCLESYFDQSMMFLRCLLGLSKVHYNSSFAGHILKFRIT